MNTSTPGKGPSPSGLIRYASASPSAVGTCTVVICISGSPFDHGQRSTNRGGIPGLVGTLSPMATRLRADAERNRSALLTAAREVFGEQGLEASLDEIARRAGVGNATLYRRFPT